MLKNNASIYSFEFLREAGVVEPEQKHVKYPGHSAKSASGRLQLNTHTSYICGFA